MKAQIASASTRNVTLQMVPVGGTTSTLGPLTPEQVTVSIAGATVANREMSARLLSPVEITVSPVLVDDKAHAAIVVDIRGLNTAALTMMLPPADYEIVAEQFRRVSAILADEAAAASPAPPPPPAR